MGFDLDSKLDEWGFFFLFNPFVNGFWGGGVTDFLYNRRSRRGR